jgi:hypothetical protein
VNSGTITPAQLASSDGEITPAEVEAYEASQRAAEDDEAERLQALEDEERDDDPAHDERLAAWTAFRTAGPDLMGLDTSAPIAWVQGAERIIRRGERQMWVANFGEGKTQAAVQFAAQVCRAGGHVIYLDVENDTREMAERLQPVVESLGECGTDERLAYRTDADLLIDGNKLASLVAALPTADLLVIDSYTRVLASLGVDENDNKAIAQFTREFVDVIAQQVGLAVLILDNTGHEGTRARGAVSKQALVETIYAVSGGKAISESEHGTLKLKLARSRSGKLAKYVTACAGGGSYGPLEPQEGDAPRESVTGEKKAAAKQRIVEHMTSEPDSAFTAKDLEGVVDVKRKTIGERYMPELIAEGLVNRVELDGVVHKWQVRIVD